MQSKVLVPALDFLQLSIDLETPFANLGLTITFKLGNIPIFNEIALVCIFFWIVMFLAYPHKPELQPLPPPPTRASTLQLAVQLCQVC